MDSGEDVLEQYRPLATLMRSIRLHSFTVDTKVLKKPPCGGFFLCTFSMGVPSLLCKFYPELTSVSVVLRRLELLSLSRKRDDACHPTGKLRSASLAVHF